MGGLASFTRPVQTRQFLLECLIQQFVPMVAKKHKQFCSPYPFHDLFLLLGNLHRRVPWQWLHLFLAFLVAFRFYSSHLASISCWIFRLMSEAHRMDNEGMFGESERSRLVQYSCIQKTEVRKTSVFWMQECEKGFFRRRWTYE
jgi:hypothetical protein